MAREKGFTLIETLIGVAIGVALIALLAVSVTRFVSSAASLDARLQTQMAADHLIERLTSDASSAWAVYVPQSDVFGNTNQDGHEVDYFSEDGSHRTLSWAYNYDASTRHLFRYSFASGQQTQKDEDLGAFETFSATTVTAAQLGTADPLFANSTIPSVSYGYDAVPGATGGNGMVRINVSAAGANRSEMLASSTAPTTFTVIVEYTPSPAPTAEPVATAPPWLVGATFTPPPTPTTAPPTAPPPTSAPTPTNPPTAAPTSWPYFAAVFYAAGADQSGNRISLISVVDLNAGGCVCAWPSGFGYEYIDGTTGSPLPPTGLSPSQLPENTPNAAIIPDNWMDPNNNPNDWAYQCGAALLSASNYPNDAAAFNGWGALAYIAPAPPSSPYYNGPATDIPYGDPPGCP